MHLTNKKIWITRPRATAAFCANGAAAYDLRGPDGGRCNKGAKSIGGDDVARYFA